MGKRNHSNSTNQKLPVFQNSQEKISVASSEDKNFDRNQINRVQTDIESEKKNPVHEKLSDFQENQRKTPVEKSKNKKIENSNCTSKTPYQCVACGSVYSDEREVRSHLLSSHGVNV